MFLAVGLAILADSFYQLPVPSRLSFPFSFGSLLFCRDLGSSCGHQPLLLCVGVACYTSARVLNSYVYSRCNLHSQLSLHYLTHPGRRCDAARLVERRGPRHQTVSEVVPHSTMHCAAVHVWRTKAKSFGRKATDVGGHCVENHEIGVELHIPLAGCL